MATTHLGSNSFLLPLSHAGQVGLFLSRGQPPSLDMTQFLWAPSPRFFGTSSGRRCGRASRASRSRISARHWSGSLRIWPDATRTDSVRFGPMAVRDQVGSPQAAFGGRRIGTATLELTQFGEGYKNRIKQILILEEQETLKPWN